MKTLELRNLTKRSDVPTRRISVRAITPDIARREEGLVRCRLRSFGFEPTILDVAELCDADIEAITHHPRLSVESIPL